MDPKFEKLSKMYPTAVFIKVDVDKCFDTVAELEISVIPTFILYRNKVPNFPSRIPTAALLEFKQFFILIDSILEIESFVLQTLMLKPSKRQLIVS